MNNLNSFLVEGNLVRDPELTITEAGNSVCNFTIASNRYYKNGSGEPIQEVSYFDCVAWNGLAEVCSEYLHKGRGVRIVGRLKQDRWIDTEGNKKARIKVICDSVDFKPVFTQH